MLIQYDEDRTILRLLAEGRTVHEIATYLSRSLRDVRAVIRRAG